MSERPLQLMLVDEDPTFRLGLRVWLEQLPGFQIAAEAASAAEALATIRKCDRTQADAFTDPTLRGQLGCPANPLSDRPRRRPFPPR